MSTQPHPRKESEKFGSSVVWLALMAVVWQSLSYCLTLMVVVWLALRVVVWLALMSCWWCFGSVSEPTRDFIFQWII
jgi:hypothetical protein